MSESVMKWISTTERMPADAEDVLVLDEYGHIHEAAFNDPKWGPGRWYDGDDKWWSPDAIAWWQPAPEFPEGFVVAYYKPWMSEPEQPTGVGYFIPPRFNRSDWFLDFPG